MDLWICGRCYDEVEETFAANCDEKPEMLLGAPIGQYHCPDCGAMCIAGVPHPPVCKRCLDKRHPGIDLIDILPTTKRLKELIKEHGTTWRILAVKDKVPALNGQRGIKIQSLNDQHTRWIPDDSAQFPSRTES